jgi:hypothetical protein
LASGKENQKKLLTAEFARGNAAEVAEENWVALGVNDVVWLPGTKARKSF